MLQESVSDSGRVSNCKRINDGLGPWGWEGANATKRATDWTGSKNSKSHKQCKSAKDRDCFKDNERGPNADRERSSSQQSAPDADLERSASQQSAPDADRERNQDRTGLRLTAKNEDSVCGSNQEESPICKSVSASELTSSTNLSSDQYDKLISLYT